MAENRPIDLSHVVEAKEEMLVGITTRFFETRSDAREAWGTSVSSQKKIVPLIAELDSSRSGEGVVADLAQRQPKQPLTKEDREYHFFPSDQDEGRHDAALYQEIFAKQPGELGEEGEKLFAMLAELWQKGFYFDKPYSLFRQDTLVDGVWHIFDEKVKDLGFITQISGDIRDKDESIGRQFLNEAGVRDLADKLGAIIRNGKDFAAEDSRDEMIRLQKIIGFLPEADCAKLRSVVSYFTAGVRAYTDIEANQLSIDGRSVIASLLPEGDIKHFFGQMASNETFPGDVSSLYQKARSLWRDSYGVGDPSTRDFLTALAVSQAIQAKDRVSGDLGVNVELLLQKLGFGWKVEKTKERRKLGFFKKSETIEEFVLEEDGREALRKLSVKEIVARLFRTLPGS